MALTEPKLTAGEKAKVAWYVGRMAKRGIAGDDVHIEDLKRKVDRITDTAADRTERDARAAFNGLETAKDELAAAKYAERRARGDEKRPARQDRIKAQEAVRRAEREARRYR